MHHDPSLHNTEPPNFWRSRYAIGLVILGAVAAYFLLTEHLAHVLGVLPYLLLLACPLMHLFMHHGHDGHSRGGHTQHTEGEQKPDASATPPATKTGAQP